MTVSIVDLFKIGIGPSSSHTVGPMKAARLFVTALDDADFEALSRIRVELFGSLAATGPGHGTPKAVILGLLGEEPETVDPTAADAQLADVRAAKKLTVLRRHPIEFDDERDIVLRARDRLPAHPNGMRFTAYDANGRVRAARVYYSIGGGFVADESGRRVDGADVTGAPYPFRSARELLDICRRTNLDIASVVLANETTMRSPDEIAHYVDRIAQVMNETIDRGCSADGELPGVLHVRRRAPSLTRSLAAEPLAPGGLREMEWVIAWALAVNEENAAGGRVVTAPTNGAAGVVPAVLRYYTTFVPGADRDGVQRFLLTATAIGGLCKENASISGAEVGCQGEIGSACAMAAGGLAAAMGGTPEQVENAAEIGLEHNLGLTCDPVAGLVQIPCIERNALAAVKAIAAARLALRGDGRHTVSLDQAILTMRRIGRDMKSKYKETSRGGLAIAVGVNVSEC
ncbi:MAG: L-serine ammonia-lyase [Acidothermus cellulolyticus]|nr:L-serine ammonia-lyase [Acidothermus cellulolyticus]